MPLQFRLPPTVCFRITRNCNARCSFCLAPPDGWHPGEPTLRFRLDWLLERGVRVIQFCGGEPTIHEALPQLIAYVHERGAKTVLSSNAIAIPGALLPLLRAAGTRVKVSLHGDRDHHDAIAGTGCFERTTRNIGRLLAAGVATSLQTTAVSGASFAVDWVIGYCLERGVRRLGVLPFLPRGNGRGLRGEFGLSGPERRALHDFLTLKRRELSGQLDLRWLDLTARPILVVEADGKVVLEGATEAMDRLIGEIPAGFA